MKKFKYILFALFLFIFPLVVKANSISNMDLDIYIDKNGTAHVKEVWDVSYTSDTELYKSYKNIGNAKITNFKVSMGGKDFTYNDNWDVNLSFNEKAYKNGINYIDDGLELCFGISKYGNNTYTLNYDIEGFVTSTDDSDMIYWNLIPPGLEIGNVHIKIYSDDYIDKTIPVWGYGNYGGTAYVYDGYIEMNSEGTLDDDEYLTILVKFDKGTFNTQNVIPNNFEYYHDMAEEGATSYSESGSSKFIDAIIIIGNILFQLIFWSSFIYAFKKAFDKQKNTIGTKYFDFGKDGKKLPNDVPNYRDIPFNKNVFRTYWIAESYKLNKNKSDFLGALLLKWLKEGKILIAKDETGKIFKKEETIIDLRNDATFDSEKEKSLFEMMKAASKDGLLESKEFEKYCKDNYSKIFGWFDGVLDFETNNLINEGKVTEGEKTGIFSSKRYIVSETMKEDAIKLKGLKNFLEEFSRIDDKEAIEVKMWEYYLIYAQILGIADKVAKQFKKLYPEIIENPELGYSYSDIVFIRSFSYSAVSSATTSRANSYSSGGGGFSSGGGGGGSFGGGGSIGSR